MPLSFNVRDIPAGGLELQGTLPGVELDLAQDGIAVPGDLEYDLSLELVGHELVVRGLLRIHLECICSLCLVRFRTEVTVSEYRYNARVAEDATIDLTESVREDIILVLPFKTLCRNGCKGICPKCGKDRNTEPCSCEDRRDDARWSALEGLKLPPETTK
ncbi:MAG: YceD family protein [Candidatus Aureabacteria bacterium]|nr:YceD family protein [Candidatus Auribacterota bacterium]